MGWLFLRLPTSFLPEEDQGYVIANIELPSGATANLTIEIIEQVEEYFGKQPAVANIITVQGFSFNGNGLNSAIAFVPLKDFSERKGAESSAQAISGKAMQSRSEEHTSELQSIMRISYAVFCLKKQKNQHNTHSTPHS